LELGPKPQAEFEFAEETKFVKVLVSLPEETSMKDLDLQVSRKSLKLDSSSKSLFMNFTSFSVDPNAKAKWLKKSKKLEVTLNKT